jgi:hypothetical protein
MVSSISTSQKFYIETQHIREKNKNKQILLRGKLDQFK